MALNVKKNHHANFELDSTILTFLDQLPIGVFRYNRTEG